MRFNENGRMHPALYREAPGEEFPIFAINWDTAAEYARWLSKKEVLAT